MVRTASAGTAGGPALVAALAAASAATLGAVSGVAGALLLAAAAGLWLRPRRRAPACCTVTEEGRS